MDGRPFDGDDNDSAPESDVPSAKRKCKTMASVSHVGYAHCHVAGDCQV